MKTSQKSSRTITTKNILKRKKVCVNLVAMFFLYYLNFEVRGLFLFFEQYLPEDWFYNNKTCKIGGQFYYTLKTQGLKVPI